MTKKYPFDPSIKHHLLIALGLAVWIFMFLFFTEPLDVSDLNTTEKLTYLPGYGVIGAGLYLLVLPFQNWLFKRNSTQWFLINEITLLLVFSIFSIVVIRFYYLIIIVDWHPNRYDFWYHLKSILLPALLTILPILIIGRYAFGKYKNKKLEQQKIEIQGEGNYESLRLLQDDLICIQSSDNYIEVFYLDGITLKKSIIRNTLSKVSETFPQFLRTHRSFIVNPFHFQSWKTEKGKHFLTLSQSLEIPVSKTYIDNIKSKLHFTTD
nr:LytTR family DNA-binding domain-containing protein [uncultured Psychroserpens sp.]